MSDKEKTKQKIQEDPDFIVSEKYNNSLEEFCQRHDEGVDNSHIAKVLLMTEEEVQETYEEAVASLKEFMGEADE